MVLVNRKFFPMIATVVSVNTYNALVPHFMKHYQRLGVDHLLVLSAASCIETVRADAASYPFASVHEISSPLLPNENFNAWKDRNENLLLEQVDCEYKMCLDIDEFHEYNDTLSNIVDWMRRTNTKAVGGKFVDRFAADYSTPAVTGDSDIFEQFPIQMSDFTSHSGANPNKVMICKKECVLEFGRHVVNVPCEYVHKVHHFKWTEDGIRNLKERLRDNSPWDNRGGKRDPNTWTLYMDELRRQLRQLERLRNPRAKIF